MPLADTMTPEQVEKALAWAVRRRERARERYYANHEENKKRQLEYYYAHHEERKTKNREAMRVRNAAVKARLAENKA